MVTGAGGYVGSRLKQALRQQAWHVAELSRAPRTGSPAIRFQLGEEVAPESLAGAEALVHCAYDFAPVSWNAICRINVSGSEKLFRAARQAKIERLIYISSMSAFESCRSWYGKAKLETEALAAAAEAVILRPGLIWGTSAGGPFGRLVAQVDRSRILPLFDRGSPVQYLVHEEDVSQIVCRCAAGALPPPSQPLTVAHEQPWEFRQVLEEIARARGKRLILVPVPWRVVWAWLRLAEVLRLPLRFHSDNLVSLMHQNPQPSFAAQRQLGIRCRPFRMESAAR